MRFQIDGYVRPGMPDANGRLYPCIPVNPSLVIPQPEYSGLPLTTVESPRTVQVRNPQRQREGTPMEPMELTKIAGDDNCRNGDCPTVYRTAYGPIALQCERLAHPPPDHQSLVQPHPDLTNPAFQLVEGQ